MGDLAEIMPRWQPWVPPKQDQALQQVCGEKGRGRKKRMGDLAEILPRWQPWAPFKQD